MENLPPGKLTSSRLEMQLRSTTVEDVPCDCLELIMERLALVDHYRGWDCLVKPLSLGASPFNTPWFLEQLQTFCGNRPWQWTCVEDQIDDDLSSPKVNDMDHFRPAGGVSPDRPAVSGHYCRLLLLDPLMGKEQELLLNLDGAKIPRILPENRMYWPISKSPWFAADKGLLVLNLHQDIKSKHGNRHDMFLVLNPINNLISVLPPIPVPLCSCKLGICSCKAVPLKLTVDQELKGGVKTIRSSSYKAYILESKKLPKRLRRNAKVFSRNFRIIAYDSMTKLWATTGVEWIGTSSYTQIFPVRDGMFYVSTGRSRYSFDDSFHDFLYKFQDGILVGKVNAPYKLKPEEEDDRYCTDHSSRAPYSCGCISTTVFEAEGKIFFFQQTSLVSFFGPNCISARIWELNDREMIWSELPVLHPHMFEICLKPQPRLGFDNIRGSLMFTYEGILIVVHGHQSNDLYYGHQGNDLYHVAGFDVFKKTWCKVPERILAILLWSRLPFREGNLADSNRFVFQPNISTRA